MKYIFLSLAAGILLISCQPVVVQKTGTAAKADSVFYYQQADINDPFLDTIFQQPDQKITLKQQIIPPPPPPPPVPKFKSIEGYRVQIFAGTDSLNALSSKHKALAVKADTAYLIAEKGLYKIQIGDFPYYPEADQRKQLLRQNGFPGAWIVKRDILIPVNPDSLTAAAETTAENSIQPAGKFKIQILATGSLENAQSLVESLKRDLNYNAFFEPSGNLFKVYIGYFKLEETARQKLSELKDKGFDDAWLVQ